MSHHFDKSQADLTREIPFGGFRSVDLPYPDNSITTAKYTAGLLPEMLFQLLQSTGYLWLLAVAVVDVVLFVQGWQRDIADAGVFVIAISMVFIRNICLELQRRGTDRRVNFQPCRVWNGSDFSDLPSGNLRCGDIIYVSNSETVPADAVLFATESPDGVCYVDNSQTLGSAEMMPKRGVPDLQRFVESANFERTISILPKLQGMLKTSSPNQDFQAFTGQLRLARAPAAVQLSLANFILKGSRVYGTGWALCCVVATGMESKVMLNARASLHFRSRLEVALHQYAWVGMGLGGLVVIANTAGFLSNRTVIPEESSVSVILMSLLLFYRFLPPMLIVLLELSRFFQILQINHSNEHIRLKSFSNLSPFAQVDYVIADKNTAFTTDKPHVHSIIFRDKIFNQCDGYRTGTHSCLEIVRRRQKNKAAGAFDVLIRGKEKKSSGDSSEHTYASIKSQARALLQGLHEPCGFRSLESQLLVGKAEDLGRLFECMVLCNTVTQLEPLKAKNKFEEAMVACGERFGFKVMEFAQDKAMLDIHGKRTVYNILAAREYSKAAKRVRVVAERANGTHGVLYVKGSVEFVGTLLDVDDELFDQIRVISLEMKQSGLVPIMLACKRLAPDQLDTVKDQIWRAQSAIMNVDSKIDAILSELETGLHYLGIACIEDPISEDTSAGVLKLAQAGIKLWMVSNDSETESLAACMRSGFFDEEGYVVPLKGIGEIRECERILGDLVCEFIYRKPITTLGDDLSSGMTARTAKLAPTFERLMSELAINSPIPRKCEYIDLLSAPFNPVFLNFRVIMDGSTFETALLTEECQRLLAALLYTAKVVCLFAALPHQKAKLVRFLKHSFAFRPTVVTFADSLSALPMLNESDARIGLRHGSESPSQYLFDAKITSLAALGDFILVSGRYAGLRFSAIAVMTLSESAIIATLMAVYMWKCGFSANSPIDMTAVWVTTCLATKPLMLYVACKSRDIAPESAVAYPQLYTFQSRHFTLYFLLKTVVKAIFVGLFIAFWMDFDMKTALSPLGMTENAQSLTGSLSISLFLTVTGSLMAEHMERNAFFWLSCLVNLVLFLFESVLLNYLSSDLLAYMEITLSIPQLVLKSLVIPLFPIALSYAFHAYNGLFQASLTAHLGRMEPVKHVATLAGLWTPSDCWTPPKSKDLFERHRFKRTFKIGSLEDNYQLSILPELIRQLQTGFMVVTLVAVGSAAQALEAAFTPKYTPLRLLFAAFCAGLFALSLSKPYKKHYITINVCSLLLFSVSANLYYILSSNSNSEVAISMAIFSFLSFHVCYSVVFLLISVNLLAYLVIGVFNILLADLSLSGAIALLSSFLEVLSVSVACAIAGYYLDEINREKFRLLTTQENELEKADNILKYLLPEFVCSRVKNGVKFIAEIQPKVHILFCEICDFDHIIKDYEAEEVITLLNHIYEKFDEICDNCGVTKVETVGKVYMACTGVKESEQDLSPELPRVSQAQRLLYFAFEIIAAMEQYRLADGQPVRIKVGIHSGKVIAGVVGYHKPQFSLVGDTVNTASRMCSTLTEQNAVQISDATYAVLKDTFGVLFESTVKQVKGKGLMEVYTVQREVGTRQLKEDLEVPDVTPELQSRNISSVSRGITVARKNSVFEGSSEMVKSFQLKKTRRQKLLKLLKCQMSTDKHYQETLELRRPEAILGLSVIFAATVVSIALELLEFIEGEGSWKETLSRSVSAVALGLLTFLSKPLFASLYFSWIALAALGVSAATLLLQSYLVYEIEDLSSDTNLVVLTVISAVHFSGMRSTQIAPFLAFVSAGITVNYIHYSEINDLSLRLACVLGEITIFFVFSLNRDVRLNRYIELKQAVKAEIEKTDHLLENLLPQHILDNMKLERNITDYLCDTTLIVADIVGFTAWSNEREPSEVIEMLSNMFTAFDKLCLKYKTYKVYTIGDCYIAMGFSGRQDYRDPKQECLNVVEMALEMKQVIAKVNDDYFTSLDMRMGVHTGEIIGAIVGTNIVRYDVYGRDVLIAFKMEANSKPGFINVSQASMAFLEEAAPGSFTYEANTTVDISAIGAKVPCYFVTPTSPA